MIIEFDFKDENLDNLWVSYQEKKSGLKKEANKLLNIIVGELEQKDDRLKIDFVKVLLGKIYVEGIEFKLQYPLLKHIVFPVILDGFKKKNMPEVRWLYQIPYIDDETNLEIDRLVDSGEIYEKILILALEINEQDRISQELLLKYYINYLDFSIHEMPTGLLCTVEEGVNVIRKADKVIEKFKFDWYKINEVKNFLEFCKELITEWENYISQNRITDFDTWCDRRDFDYIGCRAKLWKIRQKYL
jgi:hypothetical protein